MPNPSIAVRWPADGLPTKLLPTTLEKLGKNEEFLESVIAAEPALLGLENRRTSIRGPYCIFRQRPLPTPTDRLIYPDALILAASGHVLVVEVKLRNNPDLRNRSVLAQIIDYAASIAALSEHQMIGLFGGQAGQNTWVDLVAQMFPEELDSDELADVLRTRMRTGEVNLIIACDSAPPGLAEVVAGIVSQSTLGFDLDLVEITPLVEPDGDASVVLFVPAHRLATEIVARTSVTVSYRQGDEQPSTAVETTSMEEIEENIRSAAQRREARFWTPEEVEEAYRELNDPVRNNLLDFAKQHSFGGQYVSTSRTQSAAYGFCVPVQTSNGVRPRMAFYCVSNWNYVVLILVNVQKYAPPDVFSEYVERLRSIFGASVNTEGKEPSIPLDAMATHLSEFQELMLWLKSEMESALT